MPKYLVEATYQGDGIAGLRKDGGTGRRKAVQEAAKAVGGKVDAMYFAFGEADVIVILDLPDNVTAAGLALLIGSSGSVRLKTTVLLTAEEIDAAVRTEGKYRKPGG